MDELGYLADPATCSACSTASRCARPGSSSTSACTWSWRSPPATPSVGRFHPGERGRPSSVWSSCACTAGWTTTCIQFEIDRYLGLPGQAPSYKLGERIWLEARAEVQQRQRRPFDLRPSTGGLDLGSLGLDPLKAALARL